MGIFGQFSKKAYEHYFVKSLQVGMCGHDVYKRYNKWGHDRIDPMNPPKRVVLVIVQVIRSIVLK